MATIKQLQTALNILSKKLNLVTSQQDAEANGLSSFLKIQKFYTKTYTLVEFDINNGSTSYALGLTFHSLNSDKMLIMLESFSEFYDYLEYRTT